MWAAQRTTMSEPKLEILQGTLDLLVLKTLDTHGPQHGYGIARSIEEVSRNTILLNQGTIYAALVRLQQRGWITAAWGTSENKRRAKFYALTNAGMKHLIQEVRNWERIAAMMARVLSGKT